MDDTQAVARRAPAAMVRSRTVDPILSLILTMILLIDNYDSFTWNLAHLIGALGAEVEVRRNDALSAADAMAMGAQAIVLSPGPCTPNEAGISLDTVAAARETGTPLLGVCLGHQAIAQSYGGRIERAGTLMHGKTSRLRHDETGLLSGAPQGIEVTRYHSLVAARAAFPNTLQASAWAEDDGEIMALRDPERPIFGVQFHPESIASEFGAGLIHNFLAIARGKTHGKAHA